MDANTKSNAQKADDLRNEGNKSFKGGDFSQALELYSQAIELDSSKADTWSNRAFAYTKLGEYDKAVQDATKAIEIDPSSKGYYRRGAAYLALRKPKEALKDMQEAVKSFPTDKGTKIKLEECQKAVKINCFEDAISIDDSARYSVAYPMNCHIKEPEGEPQYIGPRISEGKVTLDFVTEMLDLFKKEGCICRRDAHLILSEVSKLLKLMPSLVYVDVPNGTKFTVCGDVLGQYFDLLNIFELNRLPSEENPYLFNGNFVDRGSFSVEVVLTLFAFKCLYPKAMYLARGNHEIKTVNKMLGFEGEVRLKLGEEFVHRFAEVFCFLPLAHVINNKIFVVHGGLFSGDGMLLSNIESIRRFLEPPEEGLMCDLLWSDPQPQHGRGPGKCGLAVSFGPDVTAKFLQENHLDLVIRSHAVKHEGYEIEHDGKLITVFSAPNYCNKMQNKGAFIQFKAPELKPNFVTFSSVLHADRNGNEEQAPHYLSDEKERWVVRTTRYSLFSIKVSVRHTVESDKEIIDRAEEAHDKLLSSSKKFTQEQSSALPQLQQKNPIYSTGFCVGEVGGRLRILTSTRGIEQILPQKLEYMSEDIDLAFKFEIMCLHEEEKHKKESNTHGSYCNARCLFTYLSKGLVLLEANVKSICHRDHPAIKMAFEDPSDSSAMIVFLQGWPLHREGSLALGRISNLCRGYQDLDDCPNKCQYNMDLIEIHGLCCSDGFSGGPVTNGSSKCIGVFQLSTNDYGYATSWKHVIALLGAYNMDTSRPMEEDAGKKNYKRQKVDSRRGAGR